MSIINIFSKKEKLKAFLKQMYGKELADDKIQDYTDRLIQMFSLFIEIDQKHNKKK